jgi:hypothetical protein
MFINRPRLHDLTRGRDDLKSQFRWETINAVFYKIGGFLFIIGSIFFFPRFEAYADLGAGIFFVGSLLYLVVTVHDLLEVRHHWWISGNHSRKTILEYTAAASYVWGTILFTVGSVLFFLGGVLNYWRAYVVMRKEIKGANRTGASPPDCEQEFR